MDSCKHRRFKVIKVPYLSFQFIWKESHYQTYVCAILLSSKFTKYIIHMKYSCQNNDLYEWMNEFMKVICCTFCINSIYECVFVLWS